MLLMALGPMFRIRGGLIVLRAARVRSHALAAVKDLQGRQGRPDLDHLSGEHVSHAVVVALELDVIVDVDPRRGPLVKLVTLGGQRLQSGPVKFLKEAGPATWALAEGALVQSLQALPNSGVEFRQAEEAPMAQGGDNPTLDNLNSDLNFSLVQSHQLHAI